MSQVYPLIEKLDDEYYNRKIQERENIVEICKHNRIKAKRKGGASSTKNKKPKTMKQMIASLDGEELDAYLQEQGFSLNK